MNTNLDIKNINVKNLQVMVAANKAIASGIIGALFLLGGGYFVMSNILKDQDITETGVVSSTALLGGKFAQLLALQGKLNFTDINILELARVKALKDFTENFITTLRGREDPFTPHASSRLTR